MLSSKLLVLALSSLASAAVIPRDNSVPDGWCCFSLSDPSTGKVIQQNKDYGFLYLDASQPNGLYCFNPQNPEPILFDNSDNACIIDWDGHFQCLDPTPGDDVWTLGHASSSSSSSSSLVLLHNSSPTYQACPNQGGGEIIYSGPPSTTGCRNIQLAATGFKGTCSSYTS
ncbi:hypothetical protein V8C35DRAFT_294524 [Trichoderma chlorosporum]